MIKRMQKCPSERERERKKTSDNSNMHIRYWNDVLIFLFTTCIDK